ncbi:hypothetical protein ATANTOWER_004893 [Ataeniobius toweri]|uniref:Family with sequence similarity 131 member A n=1 Tax=Ataeniobius toweri TaxID=208326 RepID=A0ABU7B270_9TELE|nr:hypothetical protein [Ataeniobius toweri]
MQRAWCPVVIGREARYTLESTERREVEGGAEETTPPCVDDARHRETFGQPSASHNHESPRTDFQVKFEQCEMIPKSGKSPADSRKSVGIHEFAALARSSLNGISQAVRDHVTKPTSLAQGRVAHLIEWKGWPKPTGPPPGTHSQFNSYCRLTEGEKEARFAAGPALPQDLWATGLSWQQMVAY